MLQTANIVLINRALIFVDMMKELLGVCGEGQHSIFFIFLIGDFVFF